MRERKLNEKWETDEESEGWYGEKREEKKKGEKDQGQERQQWRGKSNGIRTGERGKKEKESKQRYDLSPAHTHTGTISPLLLFHSLLYSLFSLHLCSGILQGPKIF